MGVDRRHVCTIGAGALFLLLAVSAIPPAGAQLEANVQITTGTFSGDAVPEGDPAVTTVTITYDCGGLDGTVQIVAEVQNVTGATATIDPTSFTAESPPDCTIGDAAATVTANLTVTGSQEVVSGADIPVVIKVGEGSKNVLQQDQVAGTHDVAATNGPFVAATFEVDTAAFEVPAGESVFIPFSASSTSNGEIMAVPRLNGTPEAWQVEPSAASIQSTLADGNGTGTGGVNVTIPEDAETGEFPLTLEIYAQSATGTNVATDTQTYDVTVTVTAANTGGSDEDSPGPGALLFVVLAMAGLGALRRRA